jgi:hypothetical protein
MLNGPDRVNVAIDKKATLEKLTEAQVPCLEWTSELGETTDKWLNEDGKYIARSQLRGSGGAGLRLLVEHPPVGATFPLYTRYYPKTHEFRVHVWKGQVIDFTQKRLEERFRQEGRREIVRSHENGWVHAHGIDDGLDPEGIESIKRGAVSAVAALNLDFGAVDILAVFGRSTRLANGRRRALHFRVCEVNTGPGLENSATIAAYADAIDTHFQSIKHRRVVRPEGIVGG